jgi:hypothetical protein
MNKFEKLYDLYLDNIYCPIRSFCRDTKMWFKYNFSLVHFKTVWTVLFKTNPFDYEYGWNIQLVWLKEQLAYFEKSDITDTTEIIRTIKWAIYMLEILTDKIKIVNHDYRDSGYLSLLKHVNYNNAYRFISEESETIKDNIFLQEELYKEKAHKLYYTILERYSRTWWD